MFEKHVASQNISREISPSYTQTGGSKQCEVPHTTFKQRSNCLTPAAKEASSCVSQCTCRHEILTLQQTCRYLFSTTEILFLQFVSLLVIFSLTNCNYTLLHFVKVMTLMRVSLFKISLDRFQFC